jgi:hypothetical protein
MQKVNDRITGLRTRIAEFWAKDGTTQRLLATGMARHDRLGADPRCGLRTIPDDVMEIIGQHMLRE